jgi:hypothetical protein
MPKGTLPSMRSPPPCKPKEQASGERFIGYHRLSGAHMISGVVMDVAAFKVSHSAGSDSDATALRAARTRSASIGAMDASSGKVQKASTHPACKVRIHVGVNQRYRALDVDPPTLPAARTTSVSIGAMDELSQKVQNASTHILRRQIHEHAHSSRSVQGSFQGASSKSKRRVMDEMAQRVQKGKHSAPKMNILL